MDADSTGSLSCVKVIHSSDELPVKSLMSLDRCHRSPSVDLIPRFRHENAIGQRPGPDNITNWQLRADQQTSRKHVTPQSVQIGKLTSWVKFFFMDLSHDVPVHV